MSLNADHERGSVNKNPLHIHHITLMMFRTLEEHLSSDVLLKQDSARSVWPTFQKVKKQIPKCINALGVLSKDGVKGSISKEGVKGSNCGSAWNAQHYWLAGLNSKRVRNCFGNCVFFRSGILFLICSSVHFLAIYSIFGAGSCHFNGYCNILEFEPLIVHSFSMIFATFWCSNLSCWMVLRD